jgi:hypothetical protein
VYLVEIPCFVTLEVYDNATNQILPGATIVLTKNNSSVLTGNTTTLGTADFSIPFDAATCFTATLAGYLPGTNCSINCERNKTVRIRVPLVPVLNTIVITVLDIRTNIPIDFANVSLTGPFSTSSGVDSNGKTTFTLVPRGSYSAGATATGYFPNSTTVGTVTFNSTLEAVIYLREAPCQVVVQVLTQLPT